MVTPGSPSDWALIAGQFQNSMRIDSFVADPNALGANTRFGGAVVSQKGRIIGHRVGLGTAGAGDTDVAVAVNGVINSGAQATLVAAATSLTVTGLAIDVEAGDVVSIETGATVDAAAVGLISSVDLLQRWR